ncbi:MAG: hypothetical protein FWE03_05085 [Firmicutes bacterium]|nr:hypothetical protein [Bacillota bacterium]
MNEKIKVKTDLSNKRFGRLVAIEPVAKTNRGEVVWLCRCDCTTEKNILGAVLTRGISNSCGCLQRELTAKRSITHGWSKTRLYKIWRGMLSRCYLLTSNRSKDYGKRGITVSNEWHCFEPFRDWALVNGYDDKLTLERLNNNGNYEPSNCCWATVKQQANNRRTNNIVNYNGKNYTVSELSALAVCSRDTLSLRLKKGWDVESAITYPPLHQKDRVRGFPACLSANR